MGVEARRARPRERPGARSAAAVAVPFGSPKPNLESSWPVRTNSWVWASTPGVIRSWTRGRGQALGVQRIEAIELVEAVDDDAADPGPERRPQLLHRLVVAVEHQAIGGDAGGEGDVELPTGGHVEEQPLLVDEAGDGAAQEGLGRVDHVPVAEDLDRLAAAGPDLVLVVDEQRRAVLRRELRDADPPDQQLPVGADGSVVGEQPGRDAAHAGVTSAPVPRCRAARARRPARGREVGQCQPAGAQRFLGAQHRARFVELREGAGQLEQVRAQAMRRPALERLPHGRVEPEDGEGQRPLFRRLEGRGDRLDAGAVDAGAAEDRPDAGVGVLQVGRGVAVEGQHPVPVEDVVLDAVGRQVGVLDGADADRPGDCGPLLRSPGRGSSRPPPLGPLDGLVEQVDQLDRLTAAAAQHLVVGPEHVAERHVHGARRRP